MSKTVKLVIEIPKEQYEYLAKIADIGEEPLGYFERVIMCGTPLDDVLQALDKSYAPTIIEADKEGGASPSVKSQESCEDAVSRQMVKEQMIYYGFHAPDMTVTEFVEDCLPYVNPQEPKTGHCKDCKWWKDSDGMFRRGIGAISNKYRSL